MGVALHEFLHQFQNLGLNLGHQRLLQEYIREIVDLQVVSEDRQVFQQDLPEAPILLLHRDAGVAFDPHLHAFVRRDHLCVLQLIHLRQWSHDLAHVGGGRLHDSLDDQLFLRTHVLPVHAFIMLVLVKHLHLRLQLSPVEVVGAVVFEQFAHYERHRLCHHLEETEQ